MNAVVLKIGGSCLSSIEEARAVTMQIAQRINDGERIVVVVSALKGVTDRLLQEAREKALEPIRLDEHLANGEIESARLIASLLTGIGIPAVVVEPKNGLWPIRTNCKHGDADPLMAECEELVLERVRPLIEVGAVPVVCGFIGVDDEGHITTMGRGGSDATAVIVGNAIRAKEVVLLKDVDGLHTADPKVDPGARQIPHISAEEALELARRGAKVIQPKALRLKHVDVPILVIGNGTGRGTLIVGRVT